MTWIITTTTISTRHPIQFEDDTKAHAESSMGHLLVAFWSFAAVAGALLLSVRKVFHGEKLAVLFDDANSNGIHIRVENVGTVWRGMHELRVNEFRRWALGYVFRK